MESNLSTMRNVVNFTAADNMYRVGYKNLEWYYLSWYLPLTILVGFLGNIACLLFMIMSRLFPKNILIWMVCISVGDLMILGLDCGRMFMKVWFQFDIRDIGEFACKVHNFLSNYFFYWSSYMQACMSVQRLSMMLHPLRARVLFPTRRVVMACVLVTVLLVAPGIPYIMFWSLNKRTSDCEPRDDSLYGVITVLDIIVWGLIPLATMTLSTIGISWAVFKASSERNTMLYQSNTLLSSSTAVPVGSGGGHSDADAWHVTRLLISMNLLYLFSAFPLLIYQIYLNAGGNKVNRIIPQQLHKTIYYSLRSICYSSSAWNWVFYCLGGRKFRRRAAQIIRKRLCFCFCNGQARFITQSFETVQFPKVNTSL